MTLWFLLAMMTVAAVFAVLWPLGRRPAAISAGHDLRVYRDQLDEIGRDRAAGRIGETEAEAARIEVSRRLLAAAEQDAAAPMASPPSRRRAVALAALVLLPLVSGGLYLALGSPSLPGQPLAARADQQATPPIEQLVAQVESYLESNPQDGRGWVQAVTADVLHAAVRRACVALERIGDLARGRPPERTPCRACAWCAERETCPVAEAPADVDDHG